MSKVFYQFLCGINFILYLLGLFLWMVLPSYTTLNVSVCLFNLSLTVVLILKNKEKVESYWKSTQFKNLMNHSIQLFLILCLLGLINYLAYKNPSQWDLTTDKINTLSRQTVQLIKKVDRPLLFKVYANQKKARSILPLLELYRLENSYLSVKLIDPEVNPLQVKKDKITKYGQVKVEYSNRVTSFTDYSEKAITNALLKVLRYHKTTLYFIRGHRAASIQDDGPQGLSHLKTYLEQEGHSVQEVSLSALQEIPPHDSALVLWGPQDGLLREELKGLKDFLQRKGSLMLGVGPQFNFDPFGPLRNLIADERWITIANDFVVDSLLAVKDSGGLVPVIETFDSRHPITLEMKGQVFFPLASSIQFMKNPKGKLSRLAQTSAFPGSWGERNLDEVKKKKVSFTKGKDLMGPVTVMGASELDGQKTLLIGNSSFVHNQYFDFQNNFLLFSNAINWLVGQDDFISFSRPKKQAEKLVLSALAMNVIFYFSVILTPFILLTLAFFFYRRRIQL